MLKHTSDGVLALHRISVDDGKRGELRSTREMYSQPCVPLGSGACKPIARTERVAVLKHTSDGALAFHRISVDDGKRSPTK